MNAQVNFEANDMSGTPSPNASATSAELAAKVRPFYWSVRRELWENRSIFIAPIVVAAIVLISSLVNYWTGANGTIPFERLTQGGDIPPQFLRIFGIGLYGMAAVIMALTAAIVGWFYCLDALYGERRERSVLFWKSLPVSDMTTVLSKALVGMVVVPAIAYVVGFALFIVLLVLTAIVLSVNGVNGMALIANNGLGEAFALHMYLALVALLWSAPLYAWAIFVSSWVRKATFLWALLPPAAIALAEGLAFGTTHFWSMIGKRLSGGFQHAFVASAENFDGKNFKFDSEQLAGSLLSLTDPGRFFSQPALWIGLVVAAAFVAAAIWMRRYREPL